MKQLFRSMQSCVQSRSFASQCTIGKDLLFEGVGVHSGKRCSVVLRAGKPNTGIIFHLKNHNGVEIPARTSNVAKTEYATVLCATSNHEAQISTVEHLLAALSASKIDNVEIHVSGPEVPILDGSSQAFMEGLRTAGRIFQRQSSRRYIRVERKVLVSDNERIASLEPAKVGNTPTLTVTVEVGFPVSKPWFVSSLATPIC